MSKHTLEITTATIEIKVIRVDGHKMTKATFRQIEVEHEIGTGKEIEHDSILGWVNDDGFWIIYSRAGKLYKRNVTKFKLYDSRLSEDQQYIRLKQIHEKMEVMQYPPPEFKKIRDAIAEYYKIDINQLKENLDQIFIAT